MVGRSLQARRRRASLEMCRASGPAAFAVVQKNWDHQGKRNGGNLVVPGLFNVPVNGIANVLKFAIRHQIVDAALVLEQNVDVRRLFANVYGEEQIRMRLGKRIINETA